MLRSFHSVLGAEAGFKTGGVLTTFISLPEARYQAIASPHLRSDRATIPIHPWSPVRRRD